MSAPRGLSADEAEAWEKVAATVAPLDKRVRRSVARGGSTPVREAAARPRDAAGGRATAAKPPPSGRFSPPAAGRREGAGKAGSGLDSHWDRKLKAGAIRPDFTLDLHGYGLDGAYDRLMSGVAQARALGARTILLVAGKPRPVDPADRATRRGAIRAKLLDWLAASEHRGAIAAVRRAHVRHGGEGALYIVLKRQG